MHNSGPRWHNWFAPPRRTTRDAQPESTVSKTNSSAKVDALLELVKTAGITDSIVIFRQRTRLALTGAMVTLIAKPQRGQLQDVSLAVYCESGRLVRTTASVEWPGQGCERTLVGNI